MEHTHTLHLSESAAHAGHPWVAGGDLAGDLPGAPCVATLLDASGQSLGSGLYDPRDPQATWRRFSLAEGAHFDFPVLLNLPESRYLKGLILQVE